MALPHPFGLRFRYAALLASVAVLLIGWAIYWITRVVEAVTMAGVPNCPGCGLMHTSNPTAKTRSDWLFRVFGCSPYKCDVCRAEYYRPDVRAAQPAAVGKNSVT